MAAIPRRPMTWLAVFLVLSSTPPSAPARPKLAQATRQISDFDTEANEERKNFEESIKGTNAGVEVACENRAAQGDANVPEGQRVTVNGKEGYSTKSGK